MSSLSDRTTGDRLRRPPPAVRWQSWPVRDEPLQALLAASAALVAAAAAYWVVGRAHLALLAAAMVAASMWRSLVPTTFELSSEGIDYAVLWQVRRIPWSEVRRYEIRDSGILLLPYSDRSALDSFGGIYLPWGDQRSEILAQVTYYLDRSAGQH